MSEIKMVRNEHGNHIILVNERPIAIVYEAAYATFFLDAQREILQLRADKADLLETLEWYERLLKVANRLSETGETVREILAKDRGKIARMVIRRMEEQIMTFDKSKVYTAINANEAREWVGKMGWVDDRISGLRKKVTEKDMDMIQTLTSVSRDETNPYCFSGNGFKGFLFFYPWEES